MKKIASSGLLLLLTARTYAGTCALCREVLQGAGNTGLIKGFYWSIILIVSVPLLILAFGFRYAWRRYK